MARFGDDGPETREEILAYGRQLGAEKAALRSKRGRKALEELRDALLRLPHKRLIEGELCDGEGVCALGAYLYRKKVDAGQAPILVWKELQQESHKAKAHYWGDSPDPRKLAEYAAKELGVAPALAIAIQVENDIDWGGSTPEQRYEGLLQWVEKKIGEAAAA